DLPTNPRVFTSKWRRMSVNYVLGRGPWTFSSRAGYNIARLWRVQDWWNQNDPNKAPLINGMRNIKYISYPGLPAVRGESHGRTTRGIYARDSRVQIRRHALSAFRRQSRYGRRKRRLSDPHGCHEQHPQ